jgi:hypothetical protein
LGGDAAAVSAAATATAVSAAAAAAVSAAAAAAAAAVLPYSGMLATGERTSLSLGVLHTAAAFPVIQTWCWHLVQVLRARGVILPLHLSRALSSLSVLSSVMTECTGGPQKLRSWSREEMRHDNDNIERVVRIGFRVDCC